MIHQKTKQYECFLITAYDRKPLLTDFTKDNSFKMLDFNTLIYEIKAAISEYGNRYPNTNLIIKDSREYPGANITKEFFQQLYGADLVIAEISSVSPNVYYELGVRMALRKFATILIALEGTELPFDLKNIRVIFYQAGKLKDKWHELHSLMEARLNGEIDSPIYDALPELEIIQRSEIDTLKQNNQELQQQICTINNEQKAFFLIDKAKELLDKNPNASSNILEKCLQFHYQSYQLAQNNFRVVFTYGRLLHSLAKYDDAIRVLEQAVNLNEQGSNPLSEPYRELGLAYRRRATKLGSDEDYRYAKDYMLKATNLNSEDDDAWGILGGLNKRLEDFDGAIECYRKGLRVNPESTYCLVNEMMLITLCLKCEASKNFTNDRMRLKKLSEQAKLQMREVTLESMDYWRVVNQAEILLLIQNSDDALKFYRRATEIVDTPDKLKSALDNIIFIQEHGDLPGTNEAKEIMSRKYQEIIPI